MFDLKFWGESWWQGIGVVAGLILTAISIILTIRYNKKKKLSYKIIYSEALFDISRQLKKDLKITYMDLEVRQLNVLKIQIINNGGVPIKKDDFDGNMELCLKDCITFFSIDVTDLYPENLKVFTSSYEEKIIISPLLLNPKESFSLNITFDGFSGASALSARIEGITEIKQITQSKLFETIDYIYVSIAFFLFTLSQYVGLVLNGKGYESEGRVVSNISAAILGILVSRAVNYYYKKNDKMKAAQKI